MNNNNNNNSIKKELDCISGLNSEDVIISGLVPESSNSVYSKGTYNEQNFNSSLSSSNSKKRKISSIINENEEKPLKKLMSSVSTTSSSSSSASSSSSTTSSEDWDQTPVNSNIESSSFVKLDQVLGSSTFISSRSDYACCGCHQEYKQSCNLCQQAEEFSRELAKDRIILEEVIGKGSFGTVYKGSFNNEWVAIKISYNENAMVDFENETKILGMLESHPNLINCKFSKKYGKIGVIVFELMDQSLNQFIVENQGFFRDISNWGNLVNIVKGIASGVEALHENNIVHVDFHPGNVLIDKVNFNAKITDFGLSKIESEQDTVSGNCARIYRPPEAIGIKNARAVQKKSSDIYQFGIMLLHLIILSNESNPIKNFEGIPDVYRDLIYSCANSNPEERPTIKDIIKTVNNW